MERVRLAGALRQPRWLLSIALAGISMVPVYLFLRVAAARIGHPFDLEWMEGGMVEHVGRVLAGEALYVEPSLDFVPFIYNPLYFWVSAGVATIVGPGYLPLRLVSVLAACAAFVLLARLVQRETGSAGAGLLAAGAFAATFESSGAWLDIARVDSLLVALLLAAVYVARFARRTAAFAAAGLLLCLAFLVKQYALVLVPALCLGIAMRAGLRPALVFGASAIGASGVVVAALQYASDGWYGFYAFAVPAAHLNPKLPAQLFLRRDLGSTPMLFAAAVAAAAVPFRGAARQKLSISAVRAQHAWIFHLGVVLTLVAMGWASRKHTGSYFNCLIVMHVGMALALGLGYGASRRRQEGFALALAALGVLHIAQLHYDPARWIPSRQDRAAGEALVEWLREQDAEVLVPYQNHLQTQAGGRAGAHQMAVFDLMKMPGDPRGVKAKLRAEAEARFAAMPWRYVLLNNTDYVFRAELERHYRISRAKVLPLERDLFYTPVSWRTRPDAVWERRGVERSGGDG